MDNAPIFLFAAVLVVAGILFALITFTKKGSTLDVQKFRVRWMTIEQQLSKTEPSSHLLCVLSADKLLDQALRDKGIRGDTMGERMKSAGSLWSNADATWSAHKLRNRIAHDTDVKVAYDEARRSLAAFKQSLKDLGAI